MTTQLSVAFGASYSAALALISLNLNGEMTFAASAAETSSDTFILWGSLDSTVADNTNAQNLGTFTAAGANPLPPGIAEQAQTWPYLIVQRTAGSTAGTFYVTGDALTNPAVVTTATPAGVLYSAVMDLRTMGASGVRIGGSALLVAGDVFDVFLTQDSAVTSSTGCFYAGRISGGNSNAGRQIAILAKGWPYAIIQRVSGSTVGTIIASGVGSFVSSVGAWVQGGNSFGAVGILGTNDAFAMRIIANAITWATSTGAISTFGVAAGTTTLTGGLTTVSALNATSANVELVATGTAGSARVRATVTATGAATAPRVVTSSGADADASTTVSAVTTGRCDTTITAGGVATANTLCTGASGSAASIGAGITGGATASASVTCTAAVGNGVRISTGATPTDRITIDQSGVIVIGNASGVAGVTIQSGSGDVLITSTDDITVTATDALSLGGGGTVNLSSAGSSLSISSGAGAGTTVTGGTMLDLQTFAANAPIRFLPVATGDTPVETRWYEAAAGGSNYVSLAAPAALAATTQYTLPAAFPTITGQNLTSTTAGVMSWAGVVNVAAGCANAQSIVDNAAAAIVTTWTEVTDSASAFVAGTGVFTVPAGAGGFYKISAAIQWAAAAAVLSAEFRVHIAINAGIVSTALFLNQVAALSQTRQVVISDGFQLAAGDTVTILVFQNSGGNIALSASALTNRLSIAFVSK